jgi:hypothetical protein
VRPRGDGVHRRGRVRTRCVWGGRRARDHGRGRKGGWVPQG